MPYLELQFDATIVIKTEADHCLRKKCPAAIAEGLPNGGDEALRRIEVESQRISPETYGQPDVSGV
jgi:hypothetical protein